LHERRLATPQDIAPLRQAVVRYAHRCGGSERQCDDIALAVSEAVTNAVIHAYRTHDVPGCITVRALLVGEQRLEVFVYDEGVWLLSRSGSPGLGLGLQFISRVCESLEIEHTRPGTRVRMTFAIA
jgi:serine/threonine-protein kinase RsbW